MYKFLLTNNIDTDGDFWYSYNAKKFHFCNSEDEAYLILVEYMKSLQSMQTRTSRKYLKKDIGEYATNWLNQNSIKEWFLPNEDFGNCSVKFSFDDITITQNDNNMCIEIEGDNE